ncbi:uncharacterized protein LOC125946350 [Dermacentor silvarum]|uniref:uncharacterized protein LOC125946350 n=1 Tax=Dermacentor silvarum TaxID=543639 RepID=UPI002100E407|nr:uncharacterized protein LOC125946350 [Dermacentor silvarum]
MASQLMDAVPADSQPASRTLVGGIETNCRSSAVVNASVTQLPAPPAGSATVTEGDGNVHPSSQEPSHHESASTIAAAKSGSLLRKPSTSGARQQLQPRDVQEASDKEAQVVRSERSNDISRRHGSFCRVTPSALRALRNAVALTDRRPSLAPAVIAAAFAARSSGFERRASRERSKHAYHTHSAQCSAVSVFYSLTALVMMAALLVLVYILSQLLYNRKDSPRATCMNHVCREYARRLLDSLNRSVDPCHSFTRFVCDGWRQRQLLSVRELIFSAATERILRVVNTMDVPLSGQSLLQRATKLYRYALERQERPKDQVRLSIQDPCPLKDIQLQ